VDELLIIELGDLVFQVDFCSVVSMPFLTGKLLKDFILMLSSSWFSQLRSLGQIERKSKNLLSVRWVEVKTVYFLFVFSENLLHILN